MANKEITNHNELDFLMNWGIDSPLDAPPDFSAIIDSVPSPDVSNNTATSCSTIQPQAVSICQKLPALQGHPSHYQTSSTNNQQPALAMDNYNMQGMQYQRQQYFGQQTVPVRSSNSYNYDHSGNRNFLPASQVTNGYSLLNDNLSTWSEVNRSDPTSSSSRTHPQAVNDFQNPTGSAYQDQYQYFSNQTSYNYKQQSCQNMPVFQNDSSRYQASYITGQQYIPASRPMTTDYYNQRTFPPQEQIYYAPQATQSHRSCSHARSNIEYDNVQQLWQATNPCSSLINLMPQMRSDQPLLSRKMTDTTVGNNNYQPASQAMHSYSPLIPQSRSDSLPASTNRIDMMPQTSSGQPLLATNTTNLMSQNSPDKPLASTKRKATPTFACEACGSVFVYKSSLMEHMKRHSDFLGYSCATCGRAFNDRSTLSKHIRTHTGERPYSCDKCNARFTQSGNLKRHERKCH